MKLMTDIESSLFNNMFEGVAPQSLADEDLAEICLKNKEQDETETTYLELTVNVPPRSKEYNKLSVLEKVRYYQLLLDLFCKQYNAVNSYHTIEYCKNGNPHMHAYIELEVPSKIYIAGTAEVLRMFAKTIFLELPRQCYKQWSCAKIDERLKLISTPSVHINIKNSLSQGWVDYINKDQN